MKSKSLILKAFAFMLALVFTFQAPLNAEAKSYKLKLPVKILIDYMDGTTETKTGKVTFQTNKYTNIGVKFSKQGQRTIQRVEIFIQNWGKYHASQKTSNAVLIKNSLYANEKNGGRTISADVDVLSDARLKKCLVVDTGNLNIYYRTLVKDDFKIMFKVAPMKAI